MFFGLGFGIIYLIWGKIEPENMQLEGFWFWLLAGQFAAGVIHYSIAKIFGPSCCFRFTTLEEESRSQKNVGTFTLCSFYYKYTTCYYTCIHI